jgi:hypothetical protein
MFLGCVLALSGSQVVLLGGGLWAQADESIREESAAMDQHDHTDGAIVRKR